jgi:hypothetical protein
MIFRPMWLGAVILAAVTGSTAIAQEQIVAAECTTDETGATASVTAVIASGR